MHVVPIPIADKQAALQYLDALERASQISRFRFKDEFSAWFDQASHEERLAMVDLSTGETDSPRSTSRAAQYTARVALMELHEHCRDMRERYVRRRFELPDDHA
jgi:hypothetical protein